MGNWEVISFSLLGWFDVLILITLSQCLYCGLLAFIMLLKNLEIGVRTLERKLLCFDLMGIHIWEVLRENMLIVVRVLYWFQKMSVHQQIFGLRPFRLLQFRLSLTFSSQARNLHLMLLTSRKVGFRFWGLLGSNFCSFFGVNLMC